LWYFLQPPYEVEQAVESVREEVKGMDFAGVFVRLWSVASKELWEEAVKATGLVARQ
jgi:hypothetical protein